MRSTFLLLILLGISTSSLLEYGAANDFSDSQADMISEYFLMEFVKDMAIGRATRIAGHFSEGFVFHGCDGDYDTSGSRDETL